MTTFLSIKCKKKITIFLRKYADNASLISKAIYFILSWEIHKKIKRKYSEILLKKTSDGQFLDINSNNLKKNMNTFFTKIILSKFFFS